MYTAAPLLMFIMFFYEFMFVSLLPRVNMIILGSRINYLSTSQGYRSVTCFSFCDPEMGNTEAEVHFD